MDPAKKPQTSGLAIASLVTALTCVFPAAIICGHMAMSKIKKSNGQLIGNGIALAGTIIGYVMLTVHFVLFAISILFVGARAWKRGSDRAMCMATQRHIEQAVHSYQIIKNLKPGDPLDIQDALSTMSNGSISTICPGGSGANGGGPLMISETIPLNGEPVVRCSIPDHNLNTGK